MDSSRPQPPSFRQLRYFIALEREGHFGRAAASCHISQPAFSVAIRELETRLGLQLVERSNRQVTITPAGRDIAVLARLCLRDLDQLMEIAAAQHQPLSGPLTLGVIPTIAPFLLPKCLPEIRRRFPELRLFIREERTDELLAGLDQGELDLALLALPWPTRHVTTVKLFQDRFVLACRKDTKLVDPEHFSINRLTAQTILLLEEGNCLRDHALAACRVRDLEPVNPFAASSLLTLLEMVESDLGVTLLPEIAVGSTLLNQTRIETWPLPKAGHRDIALAWRKTTGREQEFRTLGKLLARTAPIRTTDQA